MHTIHWFNPQTNDNLPIIAMNERLILSFDDFDAVFKNYQYSIVRYDKNWEPSSAFMSEFLDGYETNVIRDFSNSFNTRQHYMNYRITIPNQDVRLKLSGNYGLRVFAPGSSTPIFEKRFSVYDRMAEIGVMVERRNTPNELNQQVTVRVSAPNLDFTQNANSLQMVILKNNNWIENIVLDRPTFAQPQQLQYSQMDNLFAGGTEYSFFDTKNVQIAGFSTERVVMDDLFHHILFANSYDPTAAYLDRPDVNGNFYVRNILLPNPNVAFAEADYVYVHFGLADFTPNTGEEICVYGAFTGFECTPESTLQYVAESGLYETTMKLKQGYYNFHYAVRNVQTGEMDYTAIPGSYWQTENLYNALLYYTPWGSRYDLLIGYGEGYSRPSQR
ncbi:MAG: DUF5103 domain-containing protein [Weeksellaceae bacterium]|nr:DUF5103 domain-containing protein [Weeksellaceae bacterium]